MMVAVRRQVPESNSMFVHASSLFSRPPTARPQREVSHLRPVCVDVSVSLLFSICIHLNHLSVQPRYAFTFPLEGGLRPCTRVQDSRRAWRKSLPPLECPLCTYSTSFYDLCNLTL